MDSKLHSSPEHGLSPLNCGAFTISQGNRNLVLQTAPETIGIIYMGYLITDKKKVTAKTLLQMKAAGEKITQMTAYDFTTAGIIDTAGIDSILVGDSASNVVAGNQDTTPITLEEMIMHVLWSVHAGIV